MYLTKAIEKTEKRFTLFASSEEFGKWWLKGVLVMYFLSTWMCHEWNSKEKSFEERTQMQ